MFHSVRFHMNSFAPVVLSGALLWSGPARTQTPETLPPAQSKKMPDAQVEANVLKALAGAPDLTNQSITTTTVYGVVTISGSVATEALRTEAENLASRADGVQKVVDELTLGPASASAAVAEPGAAPLPDSTAQSNPNLQSDGTLSNSPPAQPGPDSDNTAQPPLAAGPSYGPGAPEYRQPYGAPQQSQNPYPQQSQPQYPQQRQPQYPRQSQSTYPQAGPAYPQQSPYSQPSQSPYPQGQAPYAQQQGQIPYTQQQQGPPPYGAPQQSYNYPPQRSGYGGQQPGQMVTIPSGAMVRIRINQTLDSSRTQPGTPFDGTVVSDVVADGAVAIPRGATVQGIVVNAKKSGTLTGRGEMALQLTQVVLGGQAYPLVSGVWAHHGGDKTIETVNSTAVGTGIGAVLGAVAGGGAGAAVGAGVGGALGLGSSAASHSGQVYIPAEGMLTFHLTQPTTVATLSQDEMNRIAHGVTAGPAPLPVRRRFYAPPYPYPYPYRYYGPGFYRPYYYPYPY